jgi:glycosyltransferase involved in cell wall biosynthesis
MLSLTAVLHTRNDALRLGRCLETVYPCDEIVIVDHGSTDKTVHVAREYGARIVEKNGEVTQRLDTRSLFGTEWILCLDPHESLSEALAASLFEWKLGTEAAPLSLLLREEEMAGWIENPIPQTRLVPANWNQWNGRFPLNHQPSVTLEGKLLRFAFP